MRYDREKVINKLNDLIEREFQIIVRCDREMFIAINNVQISTTLYNIRICLTNTRKQKILLKNTLKLLGMVGCFNMLMMLLIYTFVLSDQCFKPIKQ